MLFILAALMASHGLHIATRNIIGRIIVLQTC